MFNDFSLFKCLDDSLSPAGTISGRPLRGTFWNQFDQFAMLRESWSQRFRKVTCSCDRAQKLLCQEAQETKPDHGSCLIASSNSGKQPVNNPSDRIPHSPSFHHQNSFREKWMFHANGRTAIKRTLAMHVDPSADDCWTSSLGSVSIRDGIVVNGGVHWALPNVRTEHSRHGCSQARNASLARLAWRTMAWLTNSTEFKWREPAQNMNPKLLTLQRSPKILHGRKVFCRPKPN